MRQGSAVRRGRGKTRTRRHRGRRPEQESHLSQPGQRLDALTGVRFFAAIHVVIFHFGGDLGAGSAPWLQSIIGGGFASVGLFYVLSGFILTAVYGGRDLAGEARRAFWVARFARVYPAYLLGFLLWAPIAVVHRTHAVHAALTLAGVQAWVPPYATMWNYPAWSVSVEAFFYAAFPFLLHLVSRLDGPRTWRLLGLAWAASLVGPVLYLAFVPGTPNEHTSEFWLSFLKYLPAIRLPEFLFGIGVGHLWRGGKLRVPAWLPYAASAALLAALAASRAIPYVLIHNGLLLPVFGAFLVGLASTQGWMTRLLSWKPLVVLGDASYGMYILHAPVVDLFERLMRRFGVKGDWPTSPGVVVVLVVAVSLASLYLFENPARSWLRRRLTRPRPAQAIVAAGSPR